MSERFDVVVVGSGAGGGVVAGELADAGVRVLLLESGPHKTAADYMRWEAHANHELWWPPAFAEPPAPDEPPLIVFRGHCVGGTTTINTKVALRPAEQDYEKWHRASGLLGDGGEPFSERDLLPHIERTEQRLGVRERSDWQQCIKTVIPGFAALDAELEPVISYTDSNCMRCGSCLQGCPTNAGKSTLNTYIHPPWAEGRLELRAGCHVQRVRDRGPRLRTRGHRRAVLRQRRGDARGRRLRGGGGRRSAGHAAAAAALRRAGGGGRVAERRADRPPPRLSPRAAGRGPVRRDPGRAHGVSDQRPLHEVPARRGRRLRGRGGHDPGPDRLRHRAL